MAKKSAAKIRRNASRAAARGEEYTPPEPTTNSETVADAGGGESDEVVQAKSSAAKKLEVTLAALPPDINAKERRSAKRKAEAIAVEESGCSDVTELMKWYARHKANTKKKNKKMASATAKSSAQPQLSEEEQAMFDTAKKLHTSLSAIENDTNLNSKERRSAKRKAEAIASEEAGGRDTTELLQWYESIAPPPTTTSTTNTESNSGKKIPYIIFVGQLSYTTTTEMLFQHFQSTLGPTLLPTQESMKIRLLTDEKTKKSRGMAFLELDSPELMYECLKLHLTFLDGRRINVERSAGGGTASKKARITSYREHQSQYISETIDNILASFTKNGDIEREELDEGVIALCKRHSASVVEAALREYVEEKKERKIKYEESLRDGTTRKKEGEEEEGLEFRNPSAFLTHMIGRIAEEGIGKSSKGSSGGSSIGRKRNSTDDTGGRDGGAGRGRSDGVRGGGGGRGSGADGRGGRGGRGLKPTSSILQQSGVDMSISSRRRGGDGSSKIEQIFPSMSRGRGRGRGYM